MDDSDFTSLAEPHDLKCKMEHPFLTPDLAVFISDLWISPKVLTNESAI